MTNIARRRALAKKNPDQDYHQRRSDLIKAAAKVFWEKGFRATTVNDVAQAVGIDRASLYYYVSGKEELFHEVIRDATTKNVVMAEEILKRQGGAADKLRTLFLELMTSFERQYPYMFIYIQEDMVQIASERTRWEKEMKALAKRFNEAVIGIVQSGLDDGTFHKNHGSARLIAYGVIGMCNWSHRWFRPGAGETAENIGHTFADMVLDGLLSHQPSDPAKAFPSKVRTRSRKTASEGTATP
jgi:AcrR family transcriptional regulator